MIKLKEQMRFEQVRYYAGAVAAELAFPAYPTDLAKFFDSDNKQDVLFYWSGTGSAGKTLDIQIGYRDANNNVVVSGEKIATLSPDTLALVKGYGAGQAAFIVTAVGGAAPTNVSIWACVA